MKVDKVIITHTVFKPKVPWRVYWNLGWMVWCATFMGVHIGTEHWLSAGFQCFCCCLFLYMTVQEWRRCTHHTDTYTYEVPSPDSKENQ
ncbi:hypothetical protein [Bifidobacterium olomucense]|uniref:Uncharacterized protein n=1 Tax=Bifidobacterium olomucense TaxID=2675324 RepID=A0A7Y0EX93_9BIFI|nr:hypothetical protein [Bifidobacterium sp. DSM 109959]NMM98106.1 hypothetical protein [Bifidobacterium sp. DSM 109959]